MNIIKTLTSSISEKGNYCYSLPVETTKEIIKDVKQLQQENQELKDKLIEINEVINGYMPNEYAMCKSFDEIEFIISKGVE